MYSKHYQIFPIEREHKCINDKCFKVGDTCYEYHRVIFPSDLTSVAKGKFSILNKIPSLVHDKYFFIEINYPTSVPLIKLININDRHVTLRTVVAEFLLFLEEIYALESLTIPEEKIFVECVSCTTEKFEEFEKKHERAQCSICSEEVDVQLVLTCGHMFGAKCLSKWFKEKNTCPLCRRPIIPCICEGKRELNATLKPTIEYFIDEGEITTGIYKLRPYPINELLFTAFVYDRETNVFSLRYLDLYI